MLLLRRLHSFQCLHRPVTRDITSASARTSILQFFPKNTMSYSASISSSPAVPSSGETKSFAKSPAHLTIKEFHEYRVVATDMDSTLLNTEHKISARNLKALRDAHAKGIPVVFCSGRMAPCLFPYETELGIDIPMCACVMMFLCVCAIFCCFLFLSLLCRRALVFWQGLLQRRCGAWHKVSCVGCACRFAHSDVVQEGRSAKVLQRAAAFSLERQNHRILCVSWFPVVFCSV